MNEMNDKILLSVSAPVCEKLMRRQQKTITVTSKPPKFQTPFTCYLYCKDGSFASPRIVTPLNAKLANLHIVGKCVCNDIECIQEKLYTWHITNLQLYREPKSLDDVCVMRRCTVCQTTGVPGPTCYPDEGCMIPTDLKRAPHSWCYIDGMR